MKDYIAIFVCSTTKALHLELVSDLTSEAFIAALKRFCSRRGTPKDIHSDNGITFIGAKKKLGDLFKFICEINLDENEGHIGTLLNRGQMTRTIPGPIPPSPNFSTTSMIGRLTIDSFVDQITLGPHILRFLDGIRFRIWYHPAQKPSLYHQATSGSVFS
ncbi:hypothetical protein AVEN_78030-1 [Araneus ventricosus]|uniref:Integrase catalytic domain-containing protein n=1 Tax=Araneus ventricosus TaxID=182803 RepID=A0A4Y2FTF4_ARAVE|nr:hypothetical protein AVEN_78030-1 [Araneus ventricosus]